MTACVSPIPIVHDLKAIFPTLPGALSLRDVRLLCSSGEENVTGITELYIMMDLITKLSFFFYLFIPSLTKREVYLRGVEFIKGKAETRKTTKSL